MLVIALLAACALNPVSGRRDFVLMTERQELQLGREQFPLVLQQTGGTYRDRALEAYLEEVGQRLARVSHRPELPYRFEVANTSVPNAFAPLSAGRGRYFSPHTLALRLSAAAS